MPPRLIIALSALFLLLPFAACKKKPSPESVQEIAFNSLHKTAISEIRQIEAVRAFVLFREKDKASSLAIGEFWRRGTGQSGVEYSTELFPCYVVIDKNEKIIGTGDGFPIAGEGLIKMRWCPAPIPKTTPWVRIKTDIPSMWISLHGEYPLPSPFRYPRFTAIFPVSEVFTNAIANPFKSTEKASNAPDFIFYEIPSAWADGAVAILSGKESPDEPIEQASPLGTAFCFLHALRATEADPSLVDIPRRQLTDLITRKADPQLIETLLYLAIHPETENPYAEDYWKMLINGIKDGSIAKSSGARIGRTIGIFTSRLPDDKAMELGALLRNPTLNVTAYRDGFSSLSVEDQCFLAANSTGFISSTSQRSTFPWPKPLPAPPRTP